VDGAEFAQWLTARKAEPEGSESESESEEEHEEEHEGEHEGPVEAEAPLSHFDAVVKRFVDASTQKVLAHGYHTLFCKYDADGSGELDSWEFVTAVRAECKLTEAQVSDEELDGPGRLGGG
jgi:hypothetical protein